MPVRNIDMATPNARQYFVLPTTTAYTATATIGVLLVATYWMFRRRVPAPGSRRVRTRRLVLGLDVNGTLLEGDSFHGDLGDAALTQPALELLSELEQRHPDARIVLYTFGSDSSVVKEQLMSRRSNRWSFPPSSHFFIARAVRSEEIWAFTMPAAGDALTADVDYSAHDPVILLADPEAVVLIDSEQDRSHSLGTPCSPLRFANMRVFAAFVDGLLAAGDVVFRAAYDPQHPYFVRRSDPGSACKVLSSTGQVVAFDDNHGDWDMSAGMDAQHTVVHTLTPGLAARLNQGKEPEKMQKRHALSRQPSGKYVPTDMVAALHAIVPAV
mmetsp:Transcript_34434/g.80632  ORF Transcript_34434/g.80632 Transcript_34434/m.80632 type:complete len:327 (-) Transcript_34434:214-1194(-)|eukprot:CAMPEP_0119374894 /NCGR_PEP_ID=MMETSP1334-20130426/33401_1 /TAXON_ID=127549 /ORGANISM="Calcidiscus leptoporus, Strain RCC1130" /LENGTH=326 /DNA_ID=CAMNT_0007393083 /DNA_START=94 /DNA_END=1074 /DNA_ORIENTATION=-